jgi:two-component system response regulator
MPPALLSWRLFSTQNYLKMKNRFTIVVADDDLDDQELIKEGLRDCKIDINIVSVYDGLRLMDYLLKREEYKNEIGLADLILLDLNMPLMDGFEVLKQIRKYNLLKAIPLYVITTSRSRRDRVKAQELGATGFYSKGSSPKDIRKIVKEICQECFDDGQDEAAE